LAKKPNTQFKNMPKSLPLVLALIVFFLLGVQVGKGNLYVRGLSPHRTVSSAGPINYASVDQLYYMLSNDYDGKLDKNKLLDGIKSGLVSATGDPYTEYFNPQAAKDLNQQLSGSFTGIGAELGTNDDNNIVVVSPLDGFPAQKAGLKPKDVIVAVNGQSTAGMSVSTVVTKIRGQAGTPVKLTLVRDGGNPFEVSITRAKITVASVKWQEDGDIGYIKISQFTDDTVALANQAAQEFKDKGVKGVVLDLRGNPGGYLTGAIDISSLWLQKGQAVVSERRGATVVDTHAATGNNPLAGMPTVVLIDGGSASASEITAGALHDNKAATLVGDKSFGKGSVQKVEPLGSGAELKVTIAHWYTPAGKNINKQGITPDTQVAAGNNIASGQDPQKDKAYEVLRAKL
jgi:carboxyl-terminal processing protease